jgi:DNA repair protein SbcC/Rad50
MRIARIVLHNVKSYAGPTTIELAPGINAVCGENGAGKSTIVEALGFALFGYKPYKLDSFLREGEKSGSITVTVEDDQSCSFDVVRKLGSSTAQAVYSEIGQKLAEGEADVRTWLLAFFGLETGTDLPKLFEDTVGPPQGTLTAIFLESAGPRSKKFDRLLQIEDYAAAAQSLRAVSNLFRDQATEAERRAALMEGDARRLPEVEERQRETVLRKLELEVGLEGFRRRQAELSVGRERLERAREAVQRAEAELGMAEARERESRRRRDELEAEMKGAEEAARQLQQAEPGYRLYLETAERFKQLNGRRQERDRLRQSLELAGRTALRWEQEAASLEKRLADLATDEARVAALAQRVPEQERLEVALKGAEERVRARQEAARRIPELEARLSAAQGRLQEAAARLKEVEVARPEASRWEELRDRDRALRERLAVLEKQGWELKQAGEALDEARGRLAQVVDEAGTLELEMGSLRPMRSLAELAVERQARRDSLAAEAASLEARHQEARRTRGQVGGGLCPFFHEPCKNLRPGLSLDAHFDGVIAATGAELERVRIDLSSGDGELKESRSAERSISRLPDLERRLEQVAQERGRLEGEIVRLEQSLRELEKSPAEQAESRQALAALEPEMVKAEAARQVAATEEGWRRQSTEASETATREQETLASLRAALERDAGAEEALASAKAALAEIGDPRGEATVLRQRTGRERPEAERALERARRDLAGARAAEDRGKQLLEPFAALEEEMAEASRGRDESEPSYRLFLANQAEAGRLEQRRAVHGRAMAELQAAMELLESVRRGLEAARAAYDESERLRLQQEMEAVAGEVARGERERELCLQEGERLLQEVALLAKRKQEMETAAAEAARCRRYMESVEAVRRALDAAGPEIARALVRRISARATGIYRELLGQSAVSLEWGLDYEIRSRIRAEDREFKQLSGGEQMSAALAVRLALLQELSNLRLVFLDEPTAHMDAARRANLATQIEKLRSFDQLVVISHDDSFDTLFGHVVRLAKQNGATEVDE